MSAPQFGALLSGKEMRPQRSYLINFINHSTFNLCLICLSKSSLRLDIKLKSGFLPDFVKMFICLYLRLNYAIKMCFHEHSQSEENKKTCVEGLNQLQTNELKHIKNHFDQFRLCLTDTISSSQFSGYSNVFSLLVIA